MLCIQNVGICEYSKSKICCIHCNLKKECGDKEWGICGLVSDKIVLSVKECEGIKFNENKQHTVNIKLEGSKYEKTFKKRIISNEFDEKGST